MLPNGESGMRAVVHRDVDAEALMKALEVMSDVLTEVGEKTPA
jgi:hypothetical protein